MDERQAREKGYGYTGIYGRDKDVIKERAEQEKAKGNKVIVVTVPDSKLSRGGGGDGYSVYVIKSEANKKEEKIASLKQQLAHLNYEKDQLGTKLNEVCDKIAKIEVELIPYF